MSVEMDRPHVGGSDRGVEGSVSQTARDRLQGSPYQGLRHIVCSFADGVLTLQGRVASFYYKQLAQTTVGGIPGVSRIVNAIEVEGK